MSVTNGWKLRQVDINNAFLNGELEEEVFMQQPPGFELTGNDGSPMVCLLQKALYGLRQAPRNWYTKLQNYLVELGFKESAADTSLFVRNADSNYTYVLGYVDDIIITGSSNESVENVISKLNSKFSLKDLDDFSFFLGIAANKLEGAMFLSQK
ncbi:hypothetical protein V6N13_049764 [Hibiscus sabdariffa]